jgi:hypothetical protein
MKRHLSLLLAVLIISPTLPVIAATPACDHDPFAGVWHLNPQKSRYPGATCPKRMVIVMACAGNGVRYRSETIYADGHASRSEYNANYDGREAIVMGSGGLLLPVSLKRIDAYTVVATYRGGGQIIATSRRVVSKDGKKKMTITTNSSDQSGKNVRSIGIYEKANEATGIEEKTTKHER